MIGRKYQAVAIPERVRAFQGGVLGFFYEQGRDLPWRRTRDPYHVLVSEILLHQTQVGTVIPIYEQFLATFPTIQALADSPLEQVKAITDPLGYKVRGDWLKRIAVAVVEEYQGRIPDDLPTLMRLPGIGRYTAGAVLCFGYGQDQAIVDTNVDRLLGRYFRVTADGTERLHQIWALAESVLPHGESYAFNQGLMDMGALVCTARKPQCIYCPLAPTCETGWAALGMAGRAAEPVVEYMVRDGWRRERQPKVEGS